MWPRRFPRISLALLVTAIVPLAAARAENLQPSAAQVLDERFQDMGREAGRLRSAGQEAAADQLEARRAVWQAEREGEYNLPASDEAEIHVVGLWAGAAAPEGVVKPDERFSRGYAEVTIEHAAAPIILVAASRERMLWRLKLAPGVQLKAVIAAGRFVPEFAGLPADTLVYPTYSFMYGPNTLDPKAGVYQHTAMRKALAELTGCSVATWQGMPRYDGKPIVVGPSNRDWRDQHLVWRTRPLAAQLAAQQRERAIASLGPLEFESFFYVQMNERVGLASYGLSRGPFTLRGPRADRLEGVNSKLRSLPQAVSGGPIFALDDGELANYQPHAAEMTRVPLGTDLPGMFQSAALAVDTKRGRLVIAQNEPPYVLAACDIKDVRWTILGQTKEPLAGLTYDSDRDCFYGVTVAAPQWQTQGYRTLISEPDEEGQPRIRTPASTAAILRISAEGSTLQTIRPSSDLAMTWDRVHGSVVAVRGDKLIVSTPPTAGPWNRRLGQIVVLERDTGKMLYQGYALPGSSDAESLDLEKPPAGTGELAQVWKNLAQAESSIAELGRSLGQDKVAALAAELHEVRSAFAGRYPNMPGSPAEVHGIGIYRPGRVTVQVGPTPRPTVLVLSGHEDGDWTIRTLAGARLERIVTTGDDRQRVHGAPPGVPVENEDPEGDLIFGYRHSPAKFRRLSKAVRQRWNFRLGTYQGANTDHTQLWTVGSEDYEWRFSYASQRLNELLEKLPLTNLPPEELDGLRFFAVCETRDASEEPLSIPRRILSRRGQKTVFAEFSPRGPIHGTVEPATIDLQRCCFDSARRRVFGFKDQELHCFDPATGSSAPVELQDAAFDTLAVAYDAEQRRFFLTMRGGYLAVADEATGQVKQLGLTSGNIHALAYASDRDRLYALTSAYGDHPPQPQLVELSPTGTLLRVLPIVGVQGFDPHSGRHQLTYREGRAIVFSGLVRGDDEWKGTVCVIDPQSGQCWNFGACRERPASMSMSEQALRQYWAELLHGDDESDDEPLWSFAAGGQATVKFLSQTLAPVAPLDEATVAMLIEQLDDDASEIREQAFEQLRGYGCQALPALETAATHTSAEVRSRAKHLIEATKSEMPWSPHLRREIRAVQTLELIDSAEARLLLAKWAADVPASDRARAAKVAIERLCSENRDAWGEEVD